jgi:hypothetical protein
VKLELYKRVALRVDVPEHKLVKGDVAMLVDFVPHPKGGERGCALEVFNALGKTIAVVVVPESAIEPLTEDEVLSVRRMS